MTHKGLVINKGSLKKPDQWMISFEVFTEEELAPYAKAMRRLRISPMPPGINVRWRKVYPKAVVLAALSIVMALKMHAFWGENDPQAKQMEMIAFLKNLSMAGGLLFVFATYATAEEGAKLAFSLTKSVF